MPNVLVADDDELLCELVRFKLEAIGYEVSVVADGASAIETVQASKPDVVILDSMMPALSGPEVLQRLKSDPDVRDIPIIMLTARRSQEDVVTALRAGAADYLTKPFMPDELALRIASVLARRESGDPRARST